MTLGDSRAHYQSRWQVLTNLSCRGLTTGMQVVLQSSYLQASSWRLFRVVSLKVHDFPAALFPFKELSVKTSWGYLCRCGRQDLPVQVHSSDPLLNHTLLQGVAPATASLDTSWATRSTTSKIILVDGWHFCHPSAPPFGSRLTFSLQKLSPLSDYEDWVEPTPTAWLKLWSYGLGLAMQCPWWLVQPWSCSPVRADRNQALDFLDGVLSQKNVNQTISFTTKRKPTSQGKEPMVGNRVRRWRKRQNSEATSEALDPTKPQAATQLPRRVPSAVLKNSLRCVPVSCSWKCTG